MRFSLFSSSSLADAGRSVEAERMVRPTKRKMMAGKWLMGLAIFRCDSCFIYRKLRGFEVKKK